jgi:hypothetical protein
MSGLLRRIGACGGSIRPPLRQRKTSDIENRLGDRSLAMVDAQCGGAMGVQERGITPSGVSKRSGGKGDLQADCLKG